MKSKRVQFIVLGVVLVALVGIVWRSMGQRSSPSDEAARLVRGADLDEDSPIEDTSIVQRERRSRDATQSASRLGGAESAADEAPSESADEDKQERKTRRDRSKRGGRKAAADSDRDDTPPAKPKSPKVQVSGNRVKAGKP